MEFHQGNEEPQIEVTFDLDSDGILNVSAVEKLSGKKSNVTITNESGRMSQSEVSAKIKEAEKFREQDNENLKVINAHN